jgi:hypothetical protein
VAAAAALVAGLGAAAPAAARPTAPPLRAAALGIHGMVYLDEPRSWKAAVIHQAAALGAASLRVDVPPSQVFRTPGGPPDLAGLDDDLALARREHIRLTAILGATPAWAAACPPGTDPALAPRCPYADLRLFERHVRILARRARGVVEAWEIGNEPVGGWSYIGTVRQYAWVLHTAMKAIRSVDPHAKVLIGGLADNAPSIEFLQRVLMTPGLHLTHHLDAANLHVRGPVSSLAKQVRAWRHVMAGFGFRGPIWITEFGYPSDPAAQQLRDFGGPAEVARFGSGDSGQADYLRRALPLLLRAGAARVYVTLRNGDSGTFASEGILRGAGVGDPPGPHPRVRRKPAFGVVRQLARSGALGRRVRPGRLRPPGHRRAHRRDRASAGR